MMDARRWALLVISFVVATVGLITSQIDTAPKRLCTSPSPSLCLITSQIDTAPKLSASSLSDSTCLITSQIDTAPKLASIMSGTILV